MDHIKFLKEGGVLLDPDGDYWIYHNNKFRYFDKRGNHHFWLGISRMLADSTIVFSPPLCIRAFRSKLGAIFK